LIKPRGATHFLRYIRILTMGAIRQLSLAFPQMGGSGMGSMWRVFFGLTANTMAATDGERGEGRLEHTGGR
jgi:hypothetical protein